MQVKAKRKLKNITFDSDNAHIALVSKDAGGPANGADYALVLKNLDAEKDKDFIEKVQSVTVTFELPDFLSRFFYLYEEEASVLASMMGYVEDPQEDVMESKDEIDSWFKERFASYEIMKSLNKSDNLTSALSKLKPEEYLNLIQDQQVIEKAITELTKGSIPEVDTSTTSVEKQVEASASSKKNKKEKTMTQATVEMVEKSAFVDLEKSLETYKVELQKAQDLIKEFQEEKRQAVIKAKTDVIKSVLVDEKQTSVIAKAALALESDEDFNALVDVLKALKSAEDDSDLFKEVGASGSSSETRQDESGLTKLIKAKHNIK